MWNISKRRKKDNKGMTLVELLVAFAVSAIVLTGLSYILFTMLQFFGRANANVDVQNESQTSLNLVMDSIQACKGVCYIEQEASSIDPASDEMACALFGDLKLEEDGTKGMSFSGTAIFWQPKYREMYLMEWAMGTYVDLGNYSAPAAAPLEAIAAMKSLLPPVGEDRLPFLLAQGVTAFELKAKEECFVPPINKPEEEMTEEEKKKAGKYYFENPLVIHINMEFEQEYQNGKTVTRQMDDNVSVRNRMDHVYIQRDGKGMIKYLRNTD